MPSRPRNQGRKPTAKGLKEVLAQRTERADRPDRNAGVEIPPDAPPCPEELVGTKYGQRKYNEIILLLHSYKIATAFDRAVILQYCLAYDDWLSLRDAFEESKGKDGVTRAGWSVKSPTGVLKPNPLVSQIDRAAQRHLSLLCELGMTPAARSRVQMQDPSTGDVDEFDC